jgi:dextranase
VNEDLRVHADVPVRVDAEPGSIWARAVETGHGLVVHLIDLTHTADLAWDAPKPAASVRTNVRLELLETTGPVTFAMASPETRPLLSPVDVGTNAGYATATLPPWQTWALVLVRDA